MTYTIYLDDPRRTLWPAAHNVPGLRGNQAAILAQALQGRVGILTGGPGTGKTTVAGMLLRVVAWEHGSESIAVCAPTGKAAVRITQALQDQGLELEATTIHRLLGITRNGHDGRGWGFHFNARNPLPVRFLVVDEPSMLDVQLASSLLAAIQPGTHVLFTGDPGQLPPVGGGAVLRDLIAAGVPHGQFTETHRNGGDILRACEAIREGRRFEHSAGVDLDAGRNLLHVETPYPAHTVAAIERIAGNLPKHFDAVNDFQVMTCINGTEGKDGGSELSRRSLNPKIQQVVNPGHTKAGCRFRAGDKVMCTANSLLRMDEGNSFAVMEDEDDPGTVFVANGEIGRVQDCTPKTAVVEFSYPSRTVVFGKDDLDSVDLAYAITVHKAQGSQFPVAVYVSDDYKGARFVACRELILTAISRAETLAMTVGKRETILRDCQRETLSKRKTFLSEILKGRIAG